ncbi:GTA baseplate fiber-binding domain-containing protein [Aurantiacibacter poecillastricola]|uniref:GTA baseplate fiber-binding domain-containing protein n=1 Tax=Aurantiacibacter poecillastricola TaxID=3064385 RepID=UPI00273EDDA6|nr:phage tail protein [Aurantiacibacter sp. 219JJ12-13]MDP5260319.1 phage tail protein [Aurantiacibacter sp. 219JJ12-13]
MATLVLTAVGTAVGGPLGGALGALVGGQIDGAIFGSGSREGQRLQELSVTTSSYGTPVPRHFGTMRAAGSIIWATDLVESSEETGGKGQPSVTTYSYSTSFAVALASRPIASVERIWADGNLLRGAAGDLKVGGTFRLHTGEGDQLPDPLIAADLGAQCPAFRGLAYCVFEDLQLGDFGNRIPALTFEIVADDGAVRLQSLIGREPGETIALRALPDLEGYSDTGGPLQSTLDAIDQIYPLACDARGRALAIFNAHPSGNPIAELPEPAADTGGESFGSASGRTRQRRADSLQVPSGLRYYDVERDFQTGLQRAGGRAIPGRNRILQFPGALKADKARKLADDAAMRAGWSQDRMAYRIAELDPSLGPGQVVSLRNRPGKWRIESWEWRENGLELELLRLPYLRGSGLAADAGTALSPRDVVPGPTILHAFELPWDGISAPDQPSIHAAASSATTGWTGATLYAERSGSLVPIGGTGTKRCVTGELVSPLAASRALFIDRQASVEVQLASSDIVLTSASPEDVANGANRAVVGEEIIQFCDAHELGDGRWRLAGLLRGRGGTEHIALGGVPAGASFVLLDRKPIALDPVEVGNSETIAAIGLADTEEVIAPIIARGRTRKPLTPVHGRSRTTANGGCELSWRRRARGSWMWQGTVEVPMRETVERYEVGVGDSTRPIRSWETLAPFFSIDAATLDQLRADHAGAPVWVRQVGDYDRSEPLLLTMID